MGVGLSRAVGWRECRVGVTSAPLSNVSCHFSLCLQSETASRKQGGCNRIKTVPQSAGGGAERRVTCGEGGGARGKKVAEEKMGRGMSRFGKSAGDN